jgi:hypothetical protein
MVTKKKIPPNPVESGAKEACARQAATTRAFLSSRARFEYLFLTLIGIATLYLALQGLGNHCFWDDEATTAIMARNFIKTGSLTGWDGRNLWTYHDGAAMNRSLHCIDPPGGSLVAAISFRLFGYSNSTGRLPFVVFGIATLVFFWLLLSLEFRDNSEIRYYALLLTAFSYSFLLNIRQCRYYALCMFFSVTSYYLYMLTLEKRTYLRFCLLGVSLALLFYSNYLLCAAFLGAMVLLHLTFYIKSFTKADWAKLGLAVVLFSSLTLPYALWERIWVRPDFSFKAQGPINLFVSSIIRLCQNLRDLDLIGYIPGYCLVIAAVLIIAQRKRISASPAVWRWAVLIIGYVLTLSVISPQPAIWSNVKGDLRFADIRYLVVLLPFCAGICGWTLTLFHRFRFGRILAVLGLAIILSSNLLSFRLADSRVRWLLPAYISEIHANFRTPYDAVVEFLESKAAPNDLVYSSPEYTLCVLQWYLGEKLLTQGLLRPQTALPRERLADLHASLFLEDTFPRWIVCFGLKDPHCAGSIKFFSRTGYDYTCNSDKNTCTYIDIFNSYLVDMTRPELPFHSFGPVTPVPRASGIYIFERH